MSVPDLSLIIVSYQVRDLLERCLASLARASETIHLEIIVIDNASTDQSVEMVREKFPHVQIVANSVNAGFARANNQGLALAHGRYWMLLNPDTEILEKNANAFQLLVAFMDSHLRVGACGASLFYPDGTRQHSAFRFPTLAQIYMDLYPVNWRLRESRLNGRYPFALYEQGEPFLIDHPLGAALLVRPEAVKQVGLLDEDYFIYAEEVDWCMRIKRAGWEIWCVPQAHIIHHEARSTRQFRDKMYVELWKARFILFRKNYSKSFNKIARALIRRGMSRAIREIGDRAARGLVTQEDAGRQVTAYERVRELSYQ
jgi:N-acetylglucosaminyl-diphospho-decaprenol L-rhamnosyltransferase